MSETSSFSLVRSEDKLFLILDCQEIESRNLYLPGFKSLDNIYGQIAIETDIAEVASNNGLTKHAVVNSGKMNLIRSSRFKIKFELIGETNNIVLVMIAPSWGRWTKKRIWHIVSTELESK